MRGVQDFLKDSLPAMIDYIVVVSTPANEMMAPTNTADEMNRHDRLQIVNALRQRKKSMTTLDREAILNLPHLVDVPRQLAIITSAVIRSSRELSARPRTGDDTDLAVDEFCSKCFEVEEEAIFRVSQLATKLASENGRRASIQGVIMTSSTVSEPLDRQMPRSPIPEVTGFSNSDKSPTNSPAEVATAIDSTFAHRFEPKLPADIFCGRECTQQPTSLHTSKG